MKKAPPPFRDIVIEMVDRNLDFYSKASIGEFDIQS